LTHPTERLLGLDIARSAALLGMVCFHIVFDLQMFGYLPFGTTLHPVFYWHARLVAGSFLFLAGVSLWLAHGQGIRWPAFWRRWIKLVAAAALVTVATYVALPEYFVYFGILHCIAASSLIGLFALRLPAAAVAVLGAVIIVASYILPDPAFNAPLLRFIGLATEPAMTVDFEPLFPWVGPFLLGLASAKWASARGLLHRLTLPDTPALRRLALPGQHSLMVYVVHQPILIALIWVASYLSS
jgi:uncharacterized membrane protein